MIQKLTQDEARQINPLNLAFIGDTVWEAFVRDKIFPEYMGHSAAVLHKVCVEFVRAEAQSDAMEALLGELSEEEIRIFKRGRNQKSGHVPRNTVLADYRRATGFEALMGFLYLTGQTERLNHLMALAFEAIKTEDLELSRKV